MSDAPQVLDYRDRRPSLAMLRFQLTCTGWRFMRGAEGPWLAGDQAVALRPPGWGY